MKITPELAERLYEASKNAMEWDYSKGLDGITNAIKEIEKLNELQDIRFCMHHRDIVEGDSNKCRHGFNYDNPSLTDCIIKKFREVKDEK